MYRAGLMPAQHRALVAIEALMQGGRSPSYLQLAAHLGLSSASPIQRSLDILEEGGYISRKRGESRAITVLRPSQSILYGELDLASAHIHQHPPTILPALRGFPCLGLNLAQGEPERGRAPGDILLLYSDQTHDELPQEFLGRTFEGGKEIYHLRSDRDGFIPFRLLSIFRDLGSL